MVQYTCEQTPIKPTAMDSDNNPTPCPQHVLQCQLQMDAARVNLNYLVYGTPHHGAVVFKIELDQDLLDSLNVVMKEIGSEFLQHGRVPCAGFTTKVSGHRVMVDLLAEAMTGEKKCWSVSEVLAPRYRGVINAPDASTRVEETEVVPFFRRGPPPPAQGPGASADQNAEQPAAPETRTPAVEEPSSPPASEGEPDAEPPSSNRHKCRHCSARFASEDAANKHLAKCQARMAAELTAERVRAMEASLAAQVRAVFCLLCSTFA
jgi:hypothetical protein